jgi:thiol-disulfide isomerase/thioredoxin
MLVASLGLLASCGVAKPAIGRFVPKGRAVPLPPVPGPTNVSLEQLEGMLVGLHGTPVVLNMWASWCVPCRAETPILERAFKSTGHEVTFLGVASRDRYSDAQAFMDEFGVTPYHVGCRHVGSPRPSPLTRRVGSGHRVTVA